MTNDMHLWIVAENGLAYVIGFFGQSHGVDFPAGAGDFSGISAAAGGIGKEPVASTACARLRQSCGQIAWLR